MGFVQNRDLVIEVLGIGFPNKGAELMLAAVEDWATSLNVPFRLAVRWHVHYRHRGRLNLWGKLWHSRGERIPYGLTGRLIPRPLRTRCGFVSHDEVDLFFDASGYAYGDVWGVAKARDRMSILPSVKSSKRPLLFLPQAFGPFTDPAFKPILSRAAEAASLIYPRDQQSYRALSEIVGHQEKIRIGPDFTSTVLPQAFPGMETIRGKIGLIPNHKMFTMQEGISRSNYITYLVKIAQLLEKNSYGTVLILHEGPKDLEICQEVAEALRNRPPIISRENAREVKMAIRECSGLVTSRYHGFASALYQGTPVVATSWSHKYEELAKEFDCPESIIKTLNPEQVCETLLASIRNASKRMRSLEIAETVKGQTREMWKEIENVVGAGSTNKTLTQALTRQPNVERSTLSIK